MIWGRIDCVRIADHPEMQVQFDQARLVCVNRAQAASVAGTANMPTGNGIGGAIASGIVQGITANQIATSTANGCMAEYGFMLAHRSEHAARCAALAPPPPPASKPARKPKRKPAPVASAPPVSIVPVSASAPAATTDLK
jgi:hypothetical protein